MVSYKENRLDIVILTAIPIEVLAALKIFNEDYESARTYGTYTENREYLNALKTTAYPNVYHIGNVSDRTKTKLYSVLICKAPSYGSKKMSAEVAKIYERWNPRYFFLIGIAMAFNNKEVKLGDLVLANKVICEDYRRAERGKESHDNKTVPINTGLFEDFLSNFNTTNIRVEVNGKENSLTLDVKQGVYHSSDLMLSSTLLKKQMQKELLKQKPIVHEMESAGILLGSDDESKNIKDRLIIAKGISDYGDDNKKDSNWRYIAATHAATFTRNIIENGHLECNNTTFELDLKKYQELSEPEVKNWLGEMQFSQGLFNKAEPNFYQAWTHLLNDKKNIKNNKLIASRISTNISEIKLQQGQIAEALNKSMIALQLSKSINDKYLYSNSLFNAGKVLREAEIISLSETFFDYAKKEIQDLGEEGNILNIKTLLWSGYTKYKNHNYFEAHKEILNSFKQIMMLDPEMKKHRLLISEIADKLGRCYREIAKNHDDSSFERIGKGRFRNKPKDRIYCILEALNYYYIGYKNAIREGNYYRLAESTLSYVILFSYQPLRSIVTEIIENVKKYREPFIDYKQEKEEYCDQDFLSIFSSDYTKNLAKFYKDGMDRCNTWNYSLLKCLYLKYNADTSFQGRKFRQSFSLDAERFCVSLGNDPSMSANDESIRPQERYIAFADINEKLLNFSDSSRIEYLRVLRGKLLSNGHEKNSLFSEDYFGSLLG